MTTVRRVTDQRKKNRDLCGEIRIAKTATTRGGKERKSAKFVILNIKILYRKIFKTLFLMFLQKQNNINIQSQNGTENKGQEEKEEKTYNRI